MNMRWSTRSELTDGGVVICVLEGVERIRHYSERLAAKIRVLEALLPTLKSRAAPALLLILPRFWDSDTGVNRHLGLWRRLDNQDCKVPVSSAVAEFSVRKNGLIRFWGWKTLDHADFDPAALCLLINNKACLYLVLGATELEDAPEGEVHARDGYFRPTQQVYRWAAERKLLAGRIVGEFDDIENGFEIGGDAEAIAELAHQIGASQESG